MSLFSVFDVAGSAMNAQSVRMNVTSSNLANAGSVSGDPDKVYRARQPVFSTFQDNLNAVSGVSGVKLEGVIESSAPLTMRYQPGIIPKPMRKAMSTCQTSTRLKKWST